VAVIEPIGDQLALSSEVDVDLHDQLAAVRDLLDGSIPSDPSRLDRLAAGGELLGDWYEDWVLVEREHFRQVRLQALERMSQKLAAAGEFARAIETALAAVATEPLRESAHRALITVHLAQGNRSEAIRQYCIYRRLMHDELDLEPSNQMDELIGHIPAAGMERVTRSLTRS
jgi:DNA-binding SARP family transcriptional activator